MEVTLVSALEQMEEILPVYQDLLTGFQYNDGKRYAEYKEGDKLAEYGLTALVVGGAAVVAGKAGLFAVLAKFFAKAWKGLVIAAIAVGAFFKRLFTGGGKRYGEE